MTNVPQLKHHHLFNQHQRKNIITFAHQPPIAVLLLHCPMIHRRLKGPSNWNCGELFRGVSCLYLPHGFYSLLAAALASMAFWTTLVQDGCDYVKLEGGNVELISGSDVLPYLEVGVSQYRAPLYYTASSEWKMVYTEECLDYPMDQEKDMLWNMARWTTFCSSVLGGGKWVQFRAVVLTTTTKHF